jgi:NADPH-dependent glutamate synthase beta subunit-like oxidoreductase
MCASGVDEIKVGLCFTVRSTRRAEDKVMTRTSAARHRVAIVGSGFGGLFAAKSLGHAPDNIEVTLISRTNHHLFQPLLYQVATGILSEGEIAPATRDVLKKKKNVSVELAEVTGFDLKARNISAVRPGGRKVTLFYDSLIVAAGVGQSYFGRDEFSKWAPGMKTLADALEQRARIFGAFEMAELEDDPKVRQAWLTFAIVGGGPTGVEIAGRSWSCQGGQSSTISGASMRARRECSSSRVALRSYQLSATDSLRKRRASLRRSVLRYM